LAAESAFPIDIQERPEFLEEAQAITDNALELQSIEMPSYWRLFRWIKSEDPGALRKRSHKTVKFHDLILHPAKYRGQLVHLELNVRRILSYPAPQNSAGVETVYEVWGFSDESTWLYLGLTSELPAGMPTGATINERASFDGYFFKLQGYHESGAKPNARALKTPLLVGRLSWKAAPKPASAPRSTGWMFALAAIFAVFIIARTLLRLTARKRPTVVIRPSAKLDDDNVQKWLEDVDPADLDLPADNRYSSDA